MTTPDRMAILAAQDAAAAAYRPEPAEDTRTHQGEIMAAAEGCGLFPGNATHGASGISAPRHRSPPRP